MTTNNSNYKAKDDLIKMSSHRLKYLDVKSIHSSADVEFQTDKN